MKSKYIILLVIILFIIILFCLFKLKKTSVVISNIKSISFSYSVGYAMNSYVRYNMECGDNKCMVRVKPNGISEDEGVEVEVDKKIMLDIEEVLKKYNVNEWDGFKKSDKNVLDGDSFDISIRMVNGDSISASGYMKWPNNYGNVRGELDGIFMKIYEENK